MKLRPFLILLLALIFVSKVGAIDGEIDEVVDENVVASTSVKKNFDTDNIMSWPVMPGESLNDIARSFYPKNSAMRQLFIRQTLRLNAGIEPKLQPSRIFEEPTLLSIPTLKSLSKSRQAINATPRAKKNRQKLNRVFSMDMKLRKIPALLQQEYESLLSKNAFLRAELKRLHQKINDLQTKLSGLKLLLDKTLSVPDQQISKTLINSIASKTPKIETSAQVDQQSQIQAVGHDLLARKTFKNLNENSANDVAIAAKNVTSAKQPPAVIKPENVNEFLTSLFKYIVIAGMFLLVMGGYWIRKTRQYALANFKQPMPLMDETLMEYGGQWQDTEQASEYSFEHDLQASTKNFMNTEMRNEQANATSTLEEAKLLMTMNRTQDAIDHLKLSIEMQPKTSINHWLYLLEIFRKLNAKEDFETHAQSLHRTYNVMTPMWYETGDAAKAAIINAAIIVPQHLEEFPHIIEKLDAVWPSDLAKVYLESLITDNRDGERTGFSKSVLDEILSLIALLDTRKYI